jgi:hypothetical protein
MWVLELIKRLRPHYYVFFWFFFGVKIFKPDNQGWWPYGSTRIEWARHAVGYVVKYASKFCAVVAQYLSWGFCIYAVGGLNKESQRELRWWKSPMDVREALGAFADI